MSSTLKLVTWNIWGYHAPWAYEQRPGVVADYPTDAPQPHGGLLWKARRTALTRILAAEQPDIMALQECAEAAEPPSNQARQLADVLDYEFAYQPAYTAAGRTVGQALFALSGWQIDEVSVLELPTSNVARDKPRLAMLATLAVGDYHLRVANVHLSLDPAARLASVASLLTSDATILAGDFNEPPDGAAITRLREAGWRDVWAELYPAAPGYTMSTPAPEVRLDYVFLHPNSSLVPIAVRILGLAPDQRGFFPSDHAGLAVELANG
jgi:endonuclease/exonuclease/phosphatase family metal-dependent hydrolase